MDYSKPGVQAGGTLTPISRPDTPAGEELWRSFSAASNPWAALTPPVSIPLTAIDLAERGYNTMTGRDVPVKPGQQVISGSGENVIGDPDAPGAEVPAEPRFNLPPLITELPKRKGGFRIRAPRIDPLFDETYRPRDMRLRSQQAREQREAGVLLALQAKKLAEQKFRGVEAAEAQAAIHDEKIATARAKEARAVAEYQKKNAAVEKWAGPDQNRWFSQKFGGNAVKSFFGALLVGMSGTPTARGGLSFDLVNSFIQRDINQQVAEQGAKEKGLKGQQNLISMLRSQGDDLEAAKARAMTFQQRQAAEWFKGIAYKTDSSILKKKALLEASKMDIAANDRQNQILEREQALKAQAAMLRQKARIRAMKAARGRDPLLERMKLLKLNKATLELEKQRREMATMGKGGGTEKPSAELKKKLAGAIEGRKLLSDIMVSLDKAEEGGKYSTAATKAHRVITGGLSEYVSEEAATQAHTEGKIGGMVAAHIKAMSGADARESEIDRFRSLHVRVGEKKKVRLKKLIHWTNDRNNRLLGQLRAEPNSTLRGAVMAEMKTNHDIIRKAKSEIAKMK